MATSGSDEQPDPRDPEIREVKRKFREALERKHGRTAPQGESAEKPERGTIHRTHGPESSQRSFRRKSG
jgi:hypothetical protein